MKTIFFLLFFINSCLAQSWQLQYVNSFQEHYNNIMFIDEQTGWASGYAGLFFRTTNGGQNWQNLTAFDEGFTEVYFINSQTGFICSYNKLLKTTNSGFNWFANKTLGDVNIRTHSVQFINANTGFFSARFQTYNKLFKTTNGGASWDSISVPISINRTKFINAQTGFIYDSYYGPSISINNIYRTTNGGLNFTPYYSSDTNVSEVFFLNETTGWSIGLRFWKTTNSGATWFEMPYQFSASAMKNVFFVNEQTGFVSGGLGATNGFIRKTTNGGVNWVPTNFGESTADVSCLYFPTETKGWAGSRDGKIFAYNSSSSITQISNNIPDGYVLHQNFPNPFNPSTKIKFEIPAYQSSNKSKVNLSVIDVTGKVIKNLVNQNLVSGTYEIDFDAFNLTSGIYFYTLQTDNFRQTKKMSLVK